MAFEAMPTRGGAPKRISEQEALGLALRRLRKRADLTQDQAAERAGVVVQSWRRYEWGERDLSYDKLGKLAEALGATREELLAERAVVIHEAPGRIVDLARERQGRARAKEELGPLTIRERVQAGAWLAADDLDQGEARALPSARDPRFPHAEQWLAEVVGDSVDLLRIYDGDLVHCIEATGIGYQPRTGDVVVVERLRFQGAERELTIKQVEVESDGKVILWPRSSNPRWNGPMQLVEGLRDGEVVEIRIRALVIASIRRLG